MGTLSSEGEHATANKRSLQLLLQVLELPSGRPTWRRFEGGLMPCLIPELTVTPINHLLVLSQAEFVHPQVQEVLSRERPSFWKRKAH